jgi:hypothetical protein
MSILFGDDIRRIPFLLMLNAALSETGERFKKLLQMPNDERKQYTQ